MKKEWYTMEREGRREPEGTRRETKKREESEEREREREYVCVCCA